MPTNWAVSWNLHTAGVTRFSHFTRAECFTRWIWTLDRTFWLKVRKQMVVTLRKIENCPKSLHWRKEINVRNHKSVGRTFTTPLRIHTGKTHIYADFVALSDANFLYFRPHLTPRYKLTEKLFSVWQMSSSLRRKISLVEQLGIHLPSWFIIMNVENRCDIKDAILVRLLFIGALLKDSTVDLPRHHAWIEFSLRCALTNTC